MLYIERFFPIASAGIVLVALYVFRDGVISGANAGTLDFGVLYAAVFDWSAIQTGFLFGIFGFIAGKNDGFVKELKDTEQLAYFHNYQKTAIALGFVITFASIPLMVLNLSFSVAASWEFVVFSGWAALSMWAFFAFVRVAYIFGIIIRVRDRARVRG